MKQNKDLKKNKKNNRDGDSLGTQSDPSVGYFAKNIALVGKKKILYKGWLHIATYLHFNIFICVKYDPNLLYYTSC